MTKKHDLTADEVGEAVEEAFKPKVNKPEEKARPEPEDCTCAAVEKAGTQMPCPSCKAQGRGAYREAK